MCELSREELISMNNELKTENSLLKEENCLLKEEKCLLKTELNEYKNESKNRQKSSGSEALDRQTVDKMSFSDRFCDDLSEVILQFLPIKYKFKYECVSKQFQRTVFQKQKEIILNVELFKYRYGRPPPYIPNDLTLKYSPIYQEKDPHFAGFKSCYHQPIESLLKKCPNIQKIALNGLHYRNSKNIAKLMLRMITKYCNHLIEFKIDSEIRLKKYRDFCRKFGPKLKYYGFLKHVSDFNLFPNIESIVNYNVTETGVEKVLQLNSLNHIKKLELCIRYNNELLILPEVMQKFGQLTHLELIVKICGLNKVFKDFPFNQYLKELIISFQDNQDFEEICDSLKQIAIKCPKLKRIALDSIIILKNISEVKQLLQLLKAFPALKRLDIGLRIETDVCLDINQWFSFELFKELPKITHLDLNFYNQPLNGEKKKDIDIYLPKLQFLSIYSRLKLDMKGMTQMADNLSRLSSLQSIRLWFEHTVDYQPIEDMIIEKCLKIKTIKLLSHSS